MLNFSPFRVLFHCAYLIEELHHFFYVASFEVLKSLYMEHTESISCLPVFDLRQLAFVYFTIELQSSVMEHYCSRNTPERFGKVEVGEKLSKLPRKNKIKN